MKIEFLTYSHIPQNMYWFEFAYIYYSALSPVLILYVHAYFCNMYLGSSSSLIHVRFRATKEGCYLFNFFT